MTKVTGNQIIMIGGELHSPAIEHEIIKHGRSLIEDGDPPPVEHKVIHDWFSLVEYSNTAMITCPGIIRRHLPENDPAVIHIAQLSAYFLFVRTDNQELLMFDHLLGNRYKTRNHLV